MTKREEFYLRQAELVKKPDLTVLERAEFRILGIDAMLECGQDYNESKNIAKLISHTTGDDYVR